MGEFSIVLVVSYTVNVPDISSAMLQQRSVGAPLARQEAQVFLRQWSERVEAFHCPVGNETPVAWAKGRLSNVILDALPVHIDAYV